MGELILDINELRNSLARIGLENILFLSLQKQTVPSWRTKSKQIDEYTSIIDLEMNAEPLIGWYLPIGKFYSDSRGYKEEPDHRVERLKELFENDNILAYFTSKQPNFRLSNEDSLTVTKSMITIMEQITSAGINIMHLGMRPLNQEVIDKTKAIIHSVSYKPFCIGERNYGGVRDE